MLLKPGFEENRAKERWSQRSSQLQKYLIPNNLIWAKLPNHFVYVAKSKILLTVVLFFTNFFVCQVAFISRITLRKQLLTWWIHSPCVKDCTCPSRYDSLIINTADHKRFVCINDKAMILNLDNSNVHLSPLEDLLEI